MSDREICIIIGASHAGVNCAFALRRKGWLGKIELYDTDSNIPYHRPPLSKKFLSTDEILSKFLLKPAHSYEKSKIDLKLGTRVTKIYSDIKQIQLDNGEVKNYDKLVIATGARPLFPSIPGLKNSTLVFPLRTAADTLAIKKVLQEKSNASAIIIGGGYIGLEVAASLTNLGVQVLVLERENRVLSRVTAPEMSSFFQELHRMHHVEIVTQKDVTEIKTDQHGVRATCRDGTRYEADLLILGAGIRVNQELAMEAGLLVKDGIQVDEMARTSDPDIYAIGDCTYHLNPHYNRSIRLESVQNAVDQAKIAAASICGKSERYDTLPWFWSDQFDVKFQAVGLSHGYDKTILRKEKDQQIQQSLWYFRGDTLLAVDAVNHPKAYVLATKLIKRGNKVDQHKLHDVEIELNFQNLVVE